MWVYTTLSRNKDRSGIRMRKAETVLTFPDSVVNTHKAKLCRLPAPNVKKISSKAKCVVTDDCEQSAAPPTHSL